MPRPLLRAVFVVALFAGTLGAAAPALAADTPFSVRFAQTLRGSINAVGNQLLTCPDAAAGCADARNRVGTAATMNNNYNMGYVDVDGDPATVNSSTATLSLPAGATVAWAGLYWGADTAIGTGGSAAPDAANRGTVRFKVGAGGYQSVSAAPADVLTSTGRDTRYRAFANVTSLLPAAGNATYTVADVQTGRGDDRFAGWSLVVAYRDATEGFHRVSVYDGLGTVDRTHTFSTEITPFFTPGGSDPVATRTGLLAFEGDAGIVGETATFNETALTDAINGPGNLMNSTMATDGTLFAAKNPDYANLQGTDIDVWNRTGLLGHHQSSATLAFASNQDLFVPSALWLVSEEGPAANTAGPTVGGLARDGSTLTADPGTWQGTPTITYEYQWQRCVSGDCAAIPGATGSTYSLTPADVGSAVRVLVTAVNDAGSSAPVASAPTSSVTQLPPSNATLPQLSGSERDGQTLTTTIGGWNGTAPLGYDVQWQRCADDGTACADIPGATAWSYVLGGADIGSTVRSEVTASNGAGFAVAVSAPTNTVEESPPANTTVPEVSGAVRDGQTLTAGTGDWTGTDPLTFSYQWQRCDAAGATCADIDGATDPTYTLGAADVAGTVRVIVTASNVAGDDTSTSPTTETVAPAPPASTTPPAVTGSPVDGQTLTADSGSWTGTGPIAFSYQWQRCSPTCADIPDATEETYTLGTDDLGSTVRVVVTGDNGEQTEVPSTAVGPIAPLAPTSTSVPTVSGTVADGQTLTAGDGAWDGSLPLTFTYQWLRCDGAGAGCVTIPGATGSTYDLVPADVGHAIRVEVGAANAAGDDSAVSAPTVPARPAPPVSTTQPPAPTGTGVDGGTLTAAPGAWTGDGPIIYDYQWQRCDADGSDCADIAAATGATYSPRPADVGHAIVVEVTATNAGGSSTESSAPTAAPIAAAPPVNSVPPSITGDPADGVRLTAGPGTWTGTPAIDFDYQWQRCAADGTACEDITGATRTTYTPGPGDIGHTITVVVTATNAGGEVTSAAGEPTELVVASPPRNAVAPTISGDDEVGGTLTADRGTWSGTGTLIYTYQWQRCDATGDHCEVITGAMDETYTTTAADVGHTIAVLVTAANDAGEAEAGAQSAAAVQPKSTPTPTPTPTPTATPAPGATPTSPRPSTATLPATPGGSPGSLLGDLGSVPGSLVSDTSCQQLAGNAKYRRLKLRGIGTVRVRAYTQGPATQLTPILVTTQISHGKAKRVKVRYRLDGRRLRAGRKPSYTAAIAPSRLQRIGVHTLKARITAKGKRAKPIVLKLKTVSCRTLFTAQRWRTTAGAGLRLRIDARTALDRLAFKVPAALLPRQTAKRRTIGFMRVFVAGQSGRRRYALKLARKGRGKLLLKAAGGPVVRSVRGGVKVRGLPAGSAVAELTIYRVRTLDGATKRKRVRLRARVMRPGAGPLSLSARPRFQR